MEKLNVLSCPQFSPQNAENRILGLWNFKLFWGSTPTDLPPLSYKKGTNGPFSIRSVILFNWNLLATLIFFETPAHADNPISNGEKLHYQQSL